MKIKLGLLFFGLAASAVASAQALAKAGVLEGGNALMPAATGRVLSAGKCRFASGVYPTSPAQYVRYLREVEAWARKCPALKQGGAVEFRPMMPKMGPKPGAGE